jgi:hypothetical protein
LQWPVECHEIWSYDDNNHVQTLNGLIALCPACHEVKHIGFASVRGRAQEAKQHMMEINGWDEARANVYIANAMNLWQTRNNHKWEVNLDSLSDHGFSSLEIKKLVAKARRNPPVNQ